MLRGGGAKTSRNHIHDMGRKLLKHLTANVYSKWIETLKSPNAPLHSNAAHRHGIFKLVTSNVIFHQFYFFFLDFPSETSKSGRASCHLMGFDLHFCWSKKQRNMMAHLKSTGMGQMYKGRCPTCRCPKEVWSADWPEQAQLQGCKPELTVDPIQRLQTNGGVDSFLE